jgi:hypothetical protein
MMGLSRDLLGLFRGFSVAMGLVLALHGAVCIVVRVVVRAQTRRTIVFAARLQSCAIEGFDLLAILGRERQVKMRRLLLGLVQAQ